MGSAVLGITESKDSGKKSPYIFFGTQRAARAVPIIFLKKSLQGFAVLL